VRHPLRILLVLLPLVTSGCTGLLWRNTDWVDKPAANPDLRLFQVERQKDLLVVYDEYSERTKSIHARAYLLYKNQSRVEQNQRPHFENLRMALGLPVVPVFQEPMPANTNTLPKFCAIASTNTESFMVYSNNQMVSSHDLPMYSDPVGMAERTALSPVAVTVDTVLVAGIIYFVVIAPDNRCWPNQ